MVFGPDNQSSSKQDFYRWHLHNVKPCQDNILARVVVKLLVFVFSLIACKHGIREVGVIPGWPRRRIGVTKRDIGAIALTACMAHTSMVHDSSCNDQLAETDQPQVCSSRNIGSGIPKISYFDYL